MVLDISWNFCFEVSGGAFVTLVMPNIGTMPSARCFSSCFKTSSEVGVLAASA